MYTATVKQSQDKINLAYTLQQIDASSITSINIIEAKGVGEKVPIFPLT